MAGRTKYDIEHEKIYGKKYRFHTIHIIEKNLKDHIIEWSATVLSLLGAIYNTFLRIEGFYIWIIANALWMLFSVKYKHWGLFALNLAYMGFNVWAIIFWKTKLGI